MTDDINASIGNMAGTAIVAGFGLATFGAVNRAMGGRRRRMRRRKSKVALF
jgi:hypothetical protein